MKKIKWLLIFGFAVFASQGASAENDGFALLVASAGGDLNRVRELVEEYQVDVDYSESWGTTALHYALQNDNRQGQACDVAAYLIGKGARMDLPGDFPPKTARQLILEGRCRDWSLLGAEPID